MRKFYAKLHRKQNRQGLRKFHETGPRFPAGPAGGQRDTTGSGEKAAEERRAQWKQIKVTSYRVQRGDQLSIPHPSCRQRCGTSSTPERTLTPSRPGLPEGTIRTPSFGRGTSISSSGRATAAGEHHSGPAHGPHGRRFPCHV